MKTHREILAEAQRLEQLGWQYAEEQRRAIVELMGHQPAPRVLMAFPESATVGRDGMDGGSGDAGPVFRRWVEVAFEEGATEYRLMQDEGDGGPGEVMGERSSIVLMESDSAFDVLEEGYEVGEQDRLGELLAPYAERAEAEEIAESIDPTVVRQIEAIIGAGDFSAADRLGAKADIVDFLEGRIEPSAFISAAISRSYRRDDESQLVTERCGERIVMGRF